MTKLEIYDYILHYDIRSLADRLENLLSEDRITGGACYYVYNPYEFYSFKQIMELSSKACKSKNYFRCIKRVDTITFGIVSQTVDKGFRHRETHHLPLLPSYLCHLAVGRGNGHLHCEQAAYP